MSVQSKLSRIKIRLRGRREPTAYHAPTRRLLVFQNAVKVTMTSFGVGHIESSISAALGMAIAARAKW